MANSVKKRDQSQVAFDVVRKATGDEMEHKIRGEEERISVDGTGRTYIVVCTCDEIFEFSGPNGRRLALEAWRGHSDS
jgi:hypothetical protein